MANNKQWINNNTERVQKLVDKISNSHFTEVSDTTATASDVAVGKEFYNAEGIKTMGTNTLVPPITNYKEILITPEQFNHTTIDPLNSFNCFVCKDKTLLAYGNRRGVTYYDEDKKDFITLLSKTSDVGSSSMSCIQYDDDRVFLSSGTNGFKGVYLFNTKTKEFKRIIEEYCYNISYFRSSDGLFFIQSGFTFDYGAYLFDPNTDTVKLIGGNNMDGYEIRYEDENGNLYAWGEYHGGKGISKYDRETNSFIEIFSDIRYPEYSLQAPNNILYLANGYNKGNYSYRILRCDLNNLKFDIIETNYYGYFGYQSLSYGSIKSNRYYIDTNGDIYLSGVSSDKGIFVIKNGTNEMLKICDTGYGLASFYKYKNKLFCSYTYDSTQSDTSVHGIYCIDTTTYTATKAYDTSINWGYYQEFNGSLYVSKIYNIDSTNNALLKFNEDTNLFEIFINKPSSGSFCKVELIEGLANDWIIVYDTYSRYFYKYTISTNTLSSRLVSTSYTQIIKFKNYFYFMSTSTSSSVYPKRYDGETLTQVFDTYTPSYTMYEENGELFARSSNKAMPNDLKLNEDTGMFEITKDKYTGAIPNLKNGLEISGCSSSEYYNLYSVGYLHNPYTHIYQKLSISTYDTSNTSYTKTYNGHIVIYSYGTNKLKPTGMLIIYKE